MRLTHEFSEVHCSRMHEQGRRFVAAAGATREGSARPHARIREGTAQMAAKRGRFTPAELTPTLPSYPIPPATLQVYTLWKYGDKDTFLPIPSAKLQASTTWNLHHLHITSSQTPRTMWTRTAAYISYLQTYKFTNPGHGNITKTKILNYVTMNMLKSAVWIMGTVFIVSTSPNTQT